MPAPLILDLSHTSHTRARTGIQRVARAIRGALSGRVTAVCHDPHEGTWRPLEAWEERNLAASGPAAGRGSRWPLSARIRGRLRRFAGRTPPLAGLRGTAMGVIVPEIFSEEVAAALPALFASTSGPKVALFHDAIPLQLPEYSPRSTLARFPGYMQDLLGFDGVAAVSEASRERLLSYWDWLGVRKTPAVEAIPLAIDGAPPPAPPAAPGATPTLLCVGSIEGRKNHVALLGACESMWAAGRKFDLRLVGLANRETGSEALRVIERLRGAGRPVRYDGPASDDDLEEAYRGCTLTIYPSLAEGFGLPVAESLVRGKPCLCRMDGALGEIARGGGCTSLGEASAAEIAAAVGSLLDSPFDLANLEADARARRFRAWPEYVSELLAWMGTLSPVAL